ncbi:MAG: SPASM domain-containing protein, partial [Tannerellaceae bacterium]
NLIKLGFTNIAANVIFEEIWTKEEAMTIAEQMNQVTDYLFEHDLQDTVHIFQLNSKGMDMHHYHASSGAKDQNHCGTCTHMMCIGFDGKLYGCNRFCTMQDPIPIGDINGIAINITNQQFIKEVSKQYELYPDECKECPYGSQCPSCSAIPYEQKNVQEYINKKGQCGFTHAMVAARLYFKQRLLEGSRRHG